MPHIKHHIGKTSTLLTGSAAIVLIAFLYAIFGVQHSAPKNFISIKRGDISQQVRVNGTVQAAEDIDLSFQKAGKVAEIKAAVGDKVKKGDLLLRIDTKDAGAAIDQAKAALMAAQANYDKVLNGASGTDIDIVKATVNSAEVALTNAKNNLTSTTKQQQLIVGNALSAMLNSGLAASAAPTNSSTATLVITGVYNASDQGSYKITVVANGAGYAYDVSGLESASGQIVRGSAQAFGTHGLYLTFSVAGALSGNDYWTVAIPNTQAAAYLGNYNAYQAALQAQAQALTLVQGAVDAAQAALDQAQAQLAAKQSAARPEDIAVAQAQVSAAQAQLEAAQNVYTNSIIVAPFDGIVTSLDAKLGATVNINQNVAKIISNQKFQIITNVSEADIGKIKVGDSAAVTLDAYGASAGFDATVISVDLSTHLENNVPAYKVTLQFNNDDARIRSGMAANIIITDQAHQNVIVVPKEDLITNASDKYVLLDLGNGKSEQRKVQIGLQGLDQVEIISGLDAGARILDFSNSQN